ncbi:MAG: L,D-transpeptidase family protein [Chitinophagales bacterium]|nr:L,D-transpeptidase family protein [Chitinophagales bacterium]HPR28017.1 L,D-transpeptidase family protein [Chitinophagales bacterium]
MKHTVGVFIFCLFLACTLSEDPELPVPAHCSQVLLVETETELDSLATLFCLERTGRQWKILDSMTVMVGRKGLAADPVQLPMGYSRTKQEGDKCSPAGSYALLFAFGYAPDADTRMPYRQMTDEDICVDDSLSGAYNLPSKRTAASYLSAEDMRRSDDLYSKGIWVGYNTDPVMPGYGSCIFMHIWKDQGYPTAGCTAMSAEDMQQLFGWLDPVANPMLVQRIRGH